MACSPATLVIDASAFTGLTPEQLDLVAIALLIRWLKSINPSADTSPEALMAAATQFTGLTPVELDLVTISLLCRIAAA